MLKEFLNWFEGDFNNWKQASSRPTRFAHILLTHEKVSENQFHVVQRYKHEEKPYRDKIITIKESGNQIIVENDQCNLVFIKHNEHYYGQTVPGCIFKNTVLVSKIQMGPDFYQVIDDGFDPVTKEQKWGSENGPFFFDKTK